MKMIFAILMFAVVFGLLSGGVSAVMELVELPTMIWTQL